MFDNQKATIRIVIVMRVTIEYKVVSTVRDEQPRAFVVVQIKKFENIVMRCSEKSNPISRD